MDSFLSDQAKRLLAETIYEQTRKRFQVMKPEMLPWTALPEEHQQQFADCMRMWLDGIGSWEVMNQWFERSGQTPAFFWKQLGQMPNWHAWPGYELLLEVQKLASKGLRENTQREGENFYLGAERVIWVVRRAIAEGLSLPLIDKMLEAYADLLLKWKNMGYSGEPPSGYAMVGEYMAIERGKGSEES